MIMNVASKKMGKKDIIKIDADISLDLNVIGYVDPNATVNLIKNGELVEKKSIDLPEMLTNVINCKNPRCITTVEQELDQVFRLTDRENSVYRCIYCESKAGH
jgi:aspartate carbamoyltransferase regulatory subunit